MQFGLDVEAEPGYYDNLAPPYIAGLVVTAVVATIALAFRIYAQWLIKNLTAWDNIFAILAFLSLVPLNFFTGWQYTKGAGEHFLRVLADDPNSPMNLRSVFIAWYWCSIISVQACLWIKLAMLMFIKRVLPCDTMFFRISWWVVMAITILIGVGATVEFIFACWPIPYFWDRVIQFYGPLVGYTGPKITVGWCMPMPIYLEAPLIASFVADIFLFFLPLIPLWNMRLPVIKKFSVFLTLSLGLLAIGIDIVRIYEVIHFDVLGDVTFTNTPGVTWNAIEYNVALISACIPAMAPLLRRELWKRGTGARDQRQAFWRLGSEPYPGHGNKSDKNLLALSPTYANNDYRVWGDRSEQWRQQKPRRESDDDGSLWSGDTRAESRAGSRAQGERERLRKESAVSATVYDYRRPSESTTITESHAMAPFIKPPSSSAHGKPQVITEWV